MSPKTTEVLETASTSPPRAGPAQDPRLSSVLELTLAAVSSSGVLASAGRRAACAGRKAVEITDATPTSAYTAAAGALVITQTVMAPNTAARRRSEAIITSTRG